MEQAPRTNGQPTGGLPAVTPPSGRFIAQLFFVPGLIVAFVVLIILGINYLVVESRAPEYYLQKLDSYNPDIRWRGAHDLAQELKRPENKALRSDARFALDLADRLRKALDNLRQKEKIIAEQVKKITKEKERALAWHPLAPERNHVQFLAAALGDFVVPVAVPLLSEMVLTRDSPDFMGNILQRRKAIWALGNLGANRKGFHDLPSDEKKTIRKFLEGEAQGEEPRATWARNGLFYLEAKEFYARSDPFWLSQVVLTAALGPMPAVPAFCLRADLPPGVVEMERVLALCARDEDRYLRVQSALVLNFWDHLFAESLLLRLAHDDGYGTLIQVPDIEP